MDLPTAAQLAAQCHRSLDSLHSMIYFAPEADVQFTELGLRPGRMNYFASRAAPMGQVGPGTVTATFYNFNPELVARHIPRAWTLATPEQIVSTRLLVADAALRRLLGDTLDSPEVAEAAELAREACAACSPDGRPLYAGHADLDWPSKPHLVLWHAITLLREFRGDAHIAALVTNSLSGLDALITHTATGRGFAPEAAQATRGWSAQQWAAGEARLRENGLLDAAGALSAEGAALRSAVEQATDRASVAPWVHLGERNSLRLRELGKDLSKRVIAAGAFPAQVFAAK